MQTKVVELPFAPPSQNEWERTNPFKKPKIMLEYRDEIIRQIGEGPWRKCYPKKDIPAWMRKRIVEELKAKWKPKRKAFIEATVRRPRRFDDSNLQGGFKPMWDAFQWSGWLVTDHCKWFRFHIRDQILGDPKTVLQLWIPQTVAEEQKLDADFAAGRHA